MGLLRINLESGSSKVYNFNATLDVLYDDACGYLIDWKIKFHSGAIDTLTTASWANPKNHQHGDYNERTKILNNIGLENLTRHKKTDHKIVVLSDTQLSSLEKYFNGCEYTSTIYNICKFFKGSNPSGSYMKPSTSEMWENDSGKKYKINIFFHFFLIHNNSRNQGKINDNKEEWDKAKNTKPDDINSYLLLFASVPCCGKGSIREIFLNLQRERDATTTNYKNFKRRIKATAEEIFKNAQTVNEDVNKERKKYNSNINKSFRSNIKEAANAIWGRQCSAPDFQKAHILPVWWIKGEMFSNFGKKNYESIKSQISDVNNFLPLDAVTHSQYDKKSLFYWTDGGVIHMLKNSSFPFLEDYAQIHPDYLFKRVYYLKKYIETFKNIL